MKNNPYYLDRERRLSAKVRIDENLKKPIRVRAWKSDRWESDYVPDISLVLPSSENDS